MPNDTIRIGVALNLRDKGYAPDLFEQYTSRQTRDDVVGALATLGAEVVEIEADHDLLGRLERLGSSLHLVLNLAEGLPQCRSRNVTVPAALDHLGVEWTGSSVEGHLVAANKALARALLGERVAQPPWQTLEPSVDPGPLRIPYPVIVKPPGEGFSVGIDETSVVASDEELAGAVERLRARVRGPVLVESFLDGVEYSVGVVGNVVLPAVRWDLSRMPGSPRVRGEQLKKADLTIPHAQLVGEPEVARALATQAIAAHRGLGLRDYSRSDFRARSDSPDPFFLETNSMPGLQDLQSVLPWSAATAGVAYEEVIGSVVALALRRISPQRVRTLDVRAFEDAYRRLWERTDPSRVVHVDGHEYRMLGAAAEPGT